MCARIRSNFAYAAALLAVAALTAVVALVAVERSAAQVGDDPPRRRHSRVVEPGQDPITLGLPKPPRALDPDNDPPADGMDFAPGWAKRAAGDPPRLVHGVADLVQLDSRARAAEMKILAALQKPANLEFKHAPLPEVVASLQKKLGFPVRIDRKALRDAAIEFAGDQAACVDFEPADISLQSALEMMLHELDLTWTVRYEVLWITTPDVKYAGVDVRVIDISERNMDGEFVYDDDDALVELITSSVAPQSWDAVGGPGSIKPFHGNGVDCLVVTQTLDVHVSVEKLMSELRRSRLTSEARDQKAGRVPRGDALTGAGNPAGATAKSDAAGARRRGKQPPSLGVSGSAF
jgi:hypothetical protein